MKLTVIYLTILGLQVSAAAYSQKITINAENASLESVLKDVKRQSGYFLLYKMELMQHTRPVSVSFKDLPVEQALKQIFSGQPLEFSVSQKTILVKSAEANLAESLQKSIRGKVTDEKGDPLVGVSVKQKSANRSTYTNANGEFQLSNINDDAILIFTMIGYKAREVTVGAQQMLNVVLAAESQALEQVVVVGYGEVKRRDLTGAVSIIKPEDFADLPGVRVDNLLQGKIAGADIISSDGEPGSGTTVRIRGTRSINADNEPLYVIDGIIDAGDLNDLNPDDIASIEVLKDASSTAIYGSRGANGVILITTKQGKVGKDVVTFRTDVGMAQLPKFLDVMNAWQWADMVNENARLANPTNPNLRYDLDTIQNTNWVKEITRTAVYNTNTVTASGGSDKLRYYFSGNYANQQGIIKSSGLERYQVRLNLDKDFSKRFRGGLRINYSNIARALNSIDIGSNSGYSLSALTMPPVMTVYNDDGDFEAWNPAYGNYVNSPVSIVDMVKNQLKQKSFWGNMFLEYDIAKNLKLRTAFSATSADTRINKYEPGALPARNATNSGGRATKTSTGDQQILSETTLTFDKRWQQHHVNLMGGWTYQSRVTERMYAQGQGYFVDALEDNSLQSADKANTSITSDLVDRKMLSAIGRINYDFNRKYYITVTGRADGASNFAAEHKWAFFPSAAVKWNMAEEPWMRNLKNVLSQTSFRLSYGASGNQGIAPYQSLASLNVENNGYIFDGSLPIAYQFGNLTNSGLTWETSREWNAGLDLSFLNNRINLTADAYRTTTKNLLLEVQMPQQTGYTSRLVNIGKTQNKGLEFLLNTVNLNKGVFRWETTITTAFNQQKVLDLGPLVRVTTLVNYTAKQWPMYAYQVGMPVSSLFGAVYAGVWHSQDEIEQNKTDKQYVSATTAYYALGRQRYVDQNHNGQLDDGDMVYLGHAEPTMYGGFNNSFSYKGVSLDVYFTYQTGAKMYNATEFNMGTGTILTNQYTYMLNRWHPENNPNSDLPRVNSKDHIPNSRFVHDASYLRFKSFRVGYTFNTKNMPVKGFKGLSCYLTGTNLLLWTKYNGYDPDVSATVKSSAATTATNNSTVRRNDDGAYPNNRTLALTVSVKL
ncbi:TonB-dependent receptor [Pedobacter sp. BS3]|uniref:TonB-dependent receptor n=1 Tax=Pedobacter sp. BS3 TaxID=2567937 RepID=UPI001659B22B|nr:TonB-dependent receptor [Pedobacter sp. BS3]